jgi:uncharacterized protein YqeY
MIKKLRADLAAAMKARDSLRMDVIRGVLNEVNIREMKGIEITEEEIAKAIRSEIKKRKEAIENFTKAARQELIDKETKEMNLLQAYLPKDLTDEQILEKVKEAYAKSADKSFGAVMKASLALMNGQADGKKVSAVVKGVVGK